MQETLHSDEPDSADGLAVWKPILSAPTSGEFLLAVFEGDWDNPRQRYRVYHAKGFREGPSWAMRGNYRTEEGGAYELAGWMPLPKAPNKI